MFEDIQPSISNVGNFIKNDILIKPWEQVKI